MMGLFHMWKRTPEENPIAVQTTSPKWSKLFSVEAETGQGARATKCSLGNSYS